MTLPPWRPPVTFSLDSREPVPGTQPGPRNHDELRPLSAMCTRMISMLTSRSLQYGREDSFKLYQKGLLEDRILLGTPTKGLDCDTLLQIGAELGMPPCYRRLLLEQFSNANMVLFGVEDQHRGTVVKIYLELWDQLRQRVITTGSSEPGLLNIGVKWDARSGVHCRTDYLCFPMLSAEEILGRVELLYRDQTTHPSHDFSVRLILQAAARNPGASFIYVEVGEAGSPRKSFDINLYKANLTVSDIRPLLIQLRQRYEIDSVSIDLLLGRIGERCLGHLSGGLDRHGRDFATIYYEICML